MIQTENKKGTLTIRSSVKSFVKDEISNCMERSLKFMQDKYPHINFDIDFIFSGASCRSRYFRNEEKHDKYKMPCAHICTRDLLMLYDMKSLNIIRGKVVIDEHIQIESALVHELTHHVQYESGLPTGELLTTSNELEYLKQNYYNIWDYIMVD